MPERVSFTPSQAGGGTSSVPLGWTASPIALCWSDTKLFFANFNNLFGILVPWPKHHLDELYPSFMNLWVLAIHGFLIVYQLVFLASIGLALIFLVPYPLFLIYCAITLGVNKLIVRYLLNGPAYLDSQVDLSLDQPHPNERWLFLNGVSVGSHWLQSNTDRLTLTFRRPVRGVHNPTDGIIFDLINCLVERNFGYSTQDVREAYVQIKGALLDTNYTKVVLVLHSEGGIQGSLIVDWLLSEVPQELLGQLEIYTFGNAANHFNNPHRDMASFWSVMKGKPAPASAKSIGYIEHYGNSGDFVARWGVLHFTKIPIRYMGRIFERPGTGHLLNQHYMNAIFPLGADGKVLETNEFMDMAVDPGTHDSSPDTPNGVSPAEERNGQTGKMSVYGQDSRLTGGEQRESLFGALLSEMRPDGTVSGGQMVNDVNSPIQIVANRQSKVMRVKDFSRLWQYRNGKSPPPQQERNKTW